MPQRDWYFIAEQPAPAPHLARPEGRAALTPHWTRKAVAEHAVTATGYRGTSLIRNRTPPRTATGPYAYTYCRVLGGHCFL